LQHPGWGFFYLIIIASILCWLFYSFTKLFHLPLNEKNIDQDLARNGTGSQPLRIHQRRPDSHDTNQLTLPHLPSVWKGKTAVWVSDTHLGQVRKDGFARQIVTRIKMLHPDIVFIGGDLYDGGVVNLDKMVEPFSQISVPYGIYLLQGIMKTFMKTRPTSRLSDVLESKFYITKWWTWTDYRSLEWTTGIRGRKNSSGGFCKRWGLPLINQHFV